MCKYLNITISATIHVKGINNHAFGECFIREHYILSDL